MNSADLAPPLAIIGVGCLFPGANDFEGYWANIVKGVDGITDVPPGYWRPEDYFDADPKTPDFTYAHRGGFLSPIAFSPAAYGVAPNSIEATDTAQLLGLIAAKQALEDAGYAVGEDSDGKPLDRRNVSVILGVTGALELVIPLGARLGHPIWRRALKEAGVEATVADDVVQRIGDSYVGWQENSFPGLLGNVVAGRIANRFDLGGTNCVVDAACASSLSAIHLAAMELQTGRADVVVTGGIDTFNDIFMYMCFSKTPALSPSGNAKPFAADGDGTILGEGLGVVILKRLADAQRDGDRVYAVIRGIGSSSDGKGNAIYAPKAGGQIEALKQAYRVANVTPDTIELVEAHGTGTKVGDATEVAALMEVYQAAGRSGTWCALGSVKSQIGHTKAAAGAAGLIKATAALYHKILPPTIKVQQPAEALRSGQTPFYVNTEKRPWMPSAGHPRRAGVSAFGFGGSNFHCVLEEADPQKREIDWDGDVQILTFTGDSRQQIKTKLESFLANLPWPELRLEAARSRRNVVGTCRLHLVVENNCTDLAKLLTSARSLLEKNADKKTWHSPEGIYYGSGAPDGGLGVLFPGQGAQYVGMFRDLACHFPAMHNTLAEANDAKLSDLIYPMPAFDAATRSQNETALRSTDVAQPALGAVSLGAWRILQSFGVEASALAGHSYGELTALCAAGCFAPNDFHMLSRLRGKLMAASNAHGDAGSMLAVLAPLESITQVLREEKLDLILANKNSPQQTILSGPTATIERAAAAFTARQLRCTRLPVAAAFHSPLVAAAEQGLRAGLEKVPFQPPRVPVFANTTGQAYPGDPRQARDLLAGQLARPVEFVAEIEQLYRTGIRTFLEVGPRTHLTGMVGAILAGHPHEAFALDGSSGKRSGFFDLAATLAWLSSLGYDIQLAMWDNGTARLRAVPPEPRKPTFTVPLGGANYVKPKPQRQPTPPLAAERAVAKPQAAKTPPVVKEAATPTMNGPSSTPPANPAVVSDGTALAQALQVTRETLTALQRMQEQTAHLHRQFLEGQESAQRGVHLLIEQQQRLLQASLGFPAPAMPLATLQPATPPLAALQPLAPPQPVVIAKPQAAVAAPPQTPAVVKPQPPAPANRIETVLLNVISEKTGYPPEMLELDMALDADLGIDSIKRVEILSALQERLPDAPQIKPEHLGTLHNLRQIVAFLANGDAPTPTPLPVSTTNGAVHVSHPGQEQISRVLLEVISEKTGYPPEMLELDMALDADLGIDSIKRVEILSALQERLPDAPQIKPEHLGTLHNLRQIVAFLAEGGGVATPSVAVPFDHAEPLTAPAVERSVLRVVPLSSDSTRRRIRLSPGSEIWVASDDAELGDAVLRHLGYLHCQLRQLPLAALHQQPCPTNLAGLIVIAPSTPLDDSFLKNALFGLKNVASALRESGKKGGAVFVTVSRLDGAFGMRNIDANREPLDGGLAGLTKTASHEWPEVHCKALDLAGDFDDAAKAIADEMLLAGPLEVGLAKSGRRTLERVVQTLSAQPMETPLHPGEVVVVSGGARGVTAEVAVALAEAFRPTLVLLGRSPAPVPEPDWLLRLTHETDIKRELGQRRNGKASLKLIGEEYQKVMAQREIRQTLARIEAAGARAVYRTVDIRNGRDVAAVLAEFGLVRGLIHGAGVLADARIEDKTPEQFDRVYGTKVEGLRNLLQALSPNDLRVLVLFSSSTARFGRTGQVDYAMANEVLNKIAQQQARRLPGCRVVSVNWGPWDGGMVTPTLKKIFAQEGVGLIDLKAGADYLVHEIKSEQERSVEVVILAPVGQAALPVQTQGQTGLPVPRAFELTLDVESHPILKSHVLNGRPVLPMALILEYLAHAALHQNPGLTFHGCDDFRILHGVILEDGKPLTMRVGAGKALKRADGFVVPVELRTVRPDGRETLHARADVVLTTSLPAAPTAAIAAAEIATQDYANTPTEIYRTHLFHGPDLHGIQRVEGHGEHGIAASVRSAPLPAAWIKNPMRQQWLIDPLIVDVGFQLMILWSLEQREAGSLPCFVSRYRQYRRAFPEEGVRIVVQVTRAAELHAFADIEYVDAEGRVIARLEGYECVIDPGLQRAFERRVMVNQ